MAVYHDLLTRRTPPRYGITFRSDVTRALWDREPQNRRTYCSVCADTTLEYYRVHQRVPPLTPAGRDFTGCRWTAR